MHEYKSWQHWNLWDILSTPKSWYINHVPGAFMGGSIPDLAGQWSIVLFNENFHQFSILWSLKILWMQKSCIETGWSTYALQNSAQSRWWHVDRCRPMSRDSMKPGKVQCEVSTSMASWNRHALACLLRRCRFLKGCEIKGKTHLILKIETCSFWTIILDPFLKKSMFDVLLRSSTFDVILQILNVNMSGKYSKPHHFSTHQPWRCATGAYCSGSTAIFVNLHVNWPDCANDKGGMIEMPFRVSVGWNKFKSMNLHVPDSEQGPQRRYHLFELPNLTSSPLMYRRFGGRMNSWTYEHIHGLLPAAAIFVTCAYTCIYVNRDTYTTLNCFALCYFILRYITLYCGILAWWTNQFFGKKPSTRADPYGMASRRLGILGILGILLILSLAVGLGLLRQGLWWRMGGSKVIRMEYEWEDNWIWYAGVYMH